MTTRTTGDTGTTGNRKPHDTACAHAVAGLGPSSRRVQPPAPRPSRRTHPAGPASRTSTPPATVATSQRAGYNRRNVTLRRFPPRRRRWPPAASRDIRDTRGPRDTRDTEDTRGHPGTRGPDGSRGHRDQSDRQGSQGPPGPVRAPGPPARTARSPPGRAHSKEPHPCGVGNPYGGCRMALRDAVSSPHSCPEHG